MNRKTFVTLAAIAAILVVIALITESGRQSTSIAGASAGELLLPGLPRSIDEIDRIEIIGAGRSPLVTLEQADDGFVVAELDGYPAATSAINALLIALAETRVVEEKTADPGFYPRLGVEAVEAADAAGLEIGVVTTGAVRLSVILGDSYGSSQRYARLADATLSVLVDRDPDVARDPSDWVIDDILDIAGTRVRQVEISHSDGETLTISKTSPTESDFSVAEIPDGRELQYAGIANVTGNALQGLTLDAVRQADSSTAGDVTTTVFRTFDGLILTVTTMNQSQGDPWLQFSAGFDAGQAAESAAAPDDDEAAGAGTDSAAEAAAINSRLGNWQFRLPAFKVSQLTRRMDDLLRAPVETDPADTAPPELDQ